MTAPDLQQIADIGELTGDDKDEPKKAKPKGRATTGLKKQLSEFFKFVGGLLVAVDEFDGTVIKDNADELADQLYSLAQQNPSVKRALELLLEGGAWTGVLGVLGAKVILPITVHHDLLPVGANDRLAGVFGIPVREREGRRAVEPEPESWEFSPGSTGGIGSPTDGDN